MKYGKMYAISSDVSEKQSVVYTFGCIESDIIEQYHSDKNLNNHYSSHACNENKDDFDQELEKWGVGNNFFYEPEPVTRELKDYIEDREIYIYEEN